MLDNTKPNKKLGQNFLINEYTINTILEILDIKQEDFVLEVGPGHGALTKNIVKKTKNYIGVEKDKNLSNLLKEKYKNNIDIRNEDILKIDLKEIFLNNYRVVGNIPYNISTKLLMKCIENKDSISKIHFMMQKEFVDRVISCHGKKSYGRLSVLIQIFFKVEKYIDINPSDFYPEPKIYSSFMSLTPLKNILLEEEEIKYFLSFVKEIFNTRRKKIKNCLNIDCEVLYDNIDKRAEELSIVEMIKLYRDIKNDGKLI
jgi:16S rRNA (adenine1518-N6/adenine1519-N6)-dimethyltransferase